MPRMEEPANPKDKRILEKRLTSALTGDTQVSRMMIILPSTRYEGLVKGKHAWTDVTDSLTPEEIAAVPMPDWFDGV